MHARIGKTVTAVTFREVLTLNERLQGYTLVDRFKRRPALRPSIPQLPRDRLFGLHLVLVQVQITIAGPRLHVLRETRIGASIGETTLTHRIEPCLERAILPAPIQPLPIVTEILASSPAVRRDH